MKNQLLLLFTIHVFAISPAFAQTEPVSDSGNYVKLNKEFIVSGFADARDMLVAPAKWAKHEWLGFAAFTGASVVLYTQDDNIRNFFQQTQTPALDNISKYVIEPWGSGVYLVPFVAGVYVYGIANHKPKAETAALLTGKAVVITGTFTLLLKGITGRHRPNQDIPADPELWEGPFHGFDYISFPSGHTAVVFSAATILSFYYHEKTWVAITSYSLASLVGISRIYDDKHWATDVLAGAALGFAIGKLVYNNHKKRNNFTLSPYQNGGFQGLTVGYQVN